MLNIDEAKVDVKKIGKILVFQFLIFSVAVLIFPEIFGAGVVIDLVVAGILIIFLITIVAFVSNIVIFSIGNKESGFRKFSGKLPPIIFYISIYAWDNMFYFLCQWTSIRGVGCGAKIHFARHINYS